MSCGRFHFLLLLAALNPSVIMRLLLLRVVDVCDLLIFSFAGKKFGVTEFVSGENSGDKPVSQVALNSTTYS